MIVELTGCTGAGKTTFAKKIIEYLEKQGKYTEHNCPPKDNSRLLATFTNIKWDFKSLLHAYRIYCQYSDYLRHSISCINKCSEPLIVRLNLIRSVFRKIGTFEIMRSKCSGEGLGIIEEGTVHASHNIFVHMKSKFSEDDLKIFAQLIPLPDIIIYVRSSLPMLAKRIEGRIDPPRGYKTFDQQFLFVSHAAKMFEKLFDDERLASCTITVNGDDLTDKTVELVCDFVKNKYCEKVTC